MNFQTDLINHKPAHKFFIGIDSDGCVFDTMEVKQKKFFIPVSLEQFNLNAVSDVLRETWEFVNLYSMHRGGNRFISLIKVFDLLKERIQSDASGVTLPDLTSLRNWIASETSLSNSNLRKYFESNFDPELEKVLRWSETINQNISSGLDKIPPFPNARKAIEKLSLYVDIFVVSQTPLEALEHEWDEHDLKKYVNLIAGQEHGTKTELISLAAGNKYSPDKILMIGDALGDLQAARNNAALFYPIIPGKEDESWYRFLNEGLNKFMGGTFKGSYENALLSEFKNCLPDTPPWLYP
jgi:phosphoglycolate phosphatase-like HAD superfamily hydrolase